MNKSSAGFSRRGNLRCVWSIVHQSFCLLDCCSFYCASLEGSAACAPSRVVRNFTLPFCAGATNTTANQARTSSAERHCRREDQSSGDKFCSTARSNFSCCLTVRFTIDCKTVCKMVIVCDGIIMDSMEAAHGNYALFEQIRQRGHFNPDAAFRCVR